MPPFMTRGFVNAEGCGGRLKPTGKVSLGLM